ncbi:MAG: inlA [Paenibacillus sp.]|nr:inlA [Paenibacillus sp.]
MRDDERYIPIVWSSTKAGKNGVFGFSGGGYKSAYTPETAGSYTVKQKWNGSVWEDVSGQTDTKTVVVTANVATPRVAEQPADAAVASLGGATLRVTVTASDRGTLSYQWYSSATNSTSGGSAIQGANRESYEPPTSTEGVTYYYAVITNTTGGNSQRPGLRQARRTTA